MTNTPDFPDSSPTENVGTTGGTTATLPPIPPQPGPVPQPVRRRTNGWAIFFAIVAAAMAAMLFVVIGLLALGAAVVAGIASGEIEVDTDRVDVEIVPLTIADLPSSIVEANGKIEIDLTELDTSNLQASDGPVDLDIAVDFGSIKVIVPENLDVSVNARADLGDVTVFGDSEDGFNNTLIRRNDDAAVALDLDLDVGSIEVVRG